MPHRNIETIPSIHTKDVFEALRPTHCAYHCPKNADHVIQFSSVQFCLTLCDPMNLSTPGFPVHHQLPKFTQTHIH